MGKQALNPLGSQARRMRLIAAELAARENESLRIVEYMPQQIEAFNLTSLRDGRRQQTRVRIFCGPNRSAKTATNMFDFAMLLMGCHPIRHFPVGYHGRAFCIGRNMTALAEIYYQKLFVAGSFRVITDKETGRIRAFRPKDTEDMLRKDEVRQAPPLIPERCIVGRPTFWSKATHEIKHVTIQNDLNQIWDVSFLTALGDAPRGVDVDDIRMTEELESATYIDELYPRTMDRRGCITWDFTPQDGTDHAMSLMDEAESGKDDPQADVRMVRMSLRNNPHIDSSEVDFQIRRLNGSPGAVAVRIDGFPDTKSSRMFPDFSPRTSGIEMSEIADRHGEIPGDWCIYVGVDPGYAKAGVVFAAVPPREHPLEHSVIAYDEIFMRHESEDELVRQIKMKLGPREPYAIVMDYHMSNRTEITSTKIGEYFRRAFKKWHVRSTANGFGYRNGIADRPLRASMVRDSLVPRFGGKSTLRIVEGRCPNLEAQLRMLRRKWTKGRGGVKVHEDIPAERQVDELYDAWGYLACEDLVWHKPASPEDQVLDRNERVARERRAHKRRFQEPYAGICMGPASATEHAHTF
jgi:hypothetical protein